ncbi:MAG: hypothetical protein AAFP92_28795, partial [Bacteroidota bacterium]
NEQTIWYWAENENLARILSTERLVDLKSTWFATNRPDSKQQSGYVYSYVYHEKTSKAYDGKLLLGTHPEDENLPTKAFSGVIPEVLIYDRPLSTIERIKVESYLCMKYGISLSPYSLEPLLSSMGDTLWDRAKLYGVSNNLISLGRDDGSGYYQKQATSINQPFFLRTGFGNIERDNASNSSVIKEHEFLLIGDNGKETSFHNPMEGFPDLLKRIWVVQPIGELQGLSHTIMMDSHFFDSELEEGYEYWLLTNNSGESFSDPLGTDLFKADKYDRNGVLTYTNQWDKDKSGADIFTILKGPSLLSLVWVSPSNCQEDNHSIQVKSWGGAPSYTLRLIHLETGRKIEIADVKSEVSPIEGLAGGKYKLITIDSLGHKFETEFYLQGSDAPQFYLASTHVLPEDGYLSLDVSEGQNSGLQYSWYGPGNFSSLSPEVTISEAGKYTLALDEGGCKSLHEISVLPAEQAFFEIAKVVPNPAEPGSIFFIKVRLREKAPLDIEISDARGKLIHHSTLPAADYHTWPTSIGQAGTYQITLAVPGRIERKSLRVVIQ